MSYYTCISYTRLFICNLSICHNKFVTSKAFSCNRNIVGNFKLACFAKDDVSSDPTARIRTTSCCLVSCKRGDTIYISENVSMPRDLFRNSGYKITRDPDNADFTIIPKPQSQPKYLFADVIAYDPASGYLYLYNIDKSLLYTSDDFEMVQKYLEKEGKVVLQDKFYKDKIVELLPDYQVYRDILEDTYPNRRYVYDTSCDIDYPITISAETLSIWSHYSDSDLLVKAICASDWVKYPVTLLVFIYSHPLCLMSDNKYFKFILKQIGYQSKKLLNDMVGDIIVQPEDWNMLQDYIAYTVGIPESGGYVSEKICKSNFIYMSFLRKKTIAKPYKIDAPVAVKNLAEMVNM